MKFTVQTAKLLGCLAVSFALWTLISPAALAGAALSKAPGLDLPNEVEQGKPTIFTLLYQGDPPKSVRMVLQTPGGTVSVPGEVSPGDPTQGVAVQWTYTPINSGTYTYHFEASAGDLGACRFPADPAQDLQFVSQSLLIKYLILVGGIAICLLLVPFVVYVLARNMNRRGDPITAARIALLIGFVLSYVLFAIMFFATYGWLLTAIVAVVVLGIMVALFTTRRTA